MSEHLRAVSNNNVVHLNAERTSVEPAPVVLTRLPAAIHALREKGRLQLQGLLRELFEKVDDAMFDMADKANNNQDQNMYFDSMREIRLRRRSMEGAFFRRVDIGFAQLLDHTAYQDEVEFSGAEPSIDSLSLVQNDDLETMVAIEGMINKANEKFADGLLNLTLRIDHLVPVKVYQKNNPLGVDIICHAFNDAAKNLEVTVKARLVLFKLFDNMVMTKLGGVFQALNQLLIDANVLPSLANTSRGAKPSAPVAKEFYGAGASAGMADSPVGFDAATGMGGEELSDQVLQNLRSLLGSRRGARTNAYSLGEELASQDLMHILSMAQQQHVAGNRATSDHHAILNVRQLMQDLLAASEQQYQAINQVDDDVINLVSMMFEFILDDRNLAAPMKVLIGRLQIPMVKVAISDKSFFSKGGHPARRLLNEMAMAALGWQEAADTHHRKDALYEKMDAIVHTILSDFDSDMAIFTQLLTDFRAFLEKDKRRAQLLEQRTLDAEDGKAKSEHARLQVDIVLNRLTSGHDLAPAAIKLLREAWGNVLFIIFLKQGVDSPEWKAAIRTAQQLVWSLTAPLTKENRQGLLKLVPELLQNLREGLTSISYSPFEASELFKHLEALHLARLRSVPRVADVPEPAPVIAAVEVPVVMPSAPVAETLVVAAVEPIVEQAPILPTEEILDVAGVELAQETLLIPPEEAASTVSDGSLPEGDQHLVLVSNLRQGSWFEMLTDDGQKFRCRLAAILRSTGKYIFVNRSGVKVAEETRMSLAVALKSGRLHILDDGMLFDRALEAVIGNLRNGR